MRSSDPTHEATLEAGSAATTDTATGSAANPAAIPTRIGRYAVDAVLGRGGMGVVYRAHDAVLDRCVAVKVLAREPNPDRRAKMVHEARALARLAHPNVLTVLDVGEFEGGVFVATELVDGSTLRDHVRARPRPAADVVGLFAAAGRGLAAAHRVGVIHGDFKTENVMVDREGRVRVVDFGLARLLDDVDTPSDGLGTPAYMAPEQWARRAADARSDQFAFCVSLWESLCGAHPFGEGTALEIGARVVEGRRRLARAHPLPANLRAALERGMQVEPDDRWPSMDALLDALLAKRPRWRAWLLAAATALVAAWLVPFVVGEVTRMRQERRALAALDTCEDAETPAHPWDDAAHERTRKGLLATGKGHAAATVQRAQAALDRHVDAWRRTHANVCVAEQVQRELSFAQAEQARACLGELRGDVAELVAAWSDAKPTDLERAVSEALAVPRPEGCLDARLLRVRSALEQLPEEDAKLLRAHAGRRSLIVSVGRLSARPSSAEGVDEFERVYLLGMEHQVEEAAVSAGIQLMQIHGLDRDNLAEARRWEALTRTAAARLPPGAPHLDDIDLVAASLSEHFGASADALARLEETIARLERTLGPEHPTVGRLLHNASNSAYALGQADRAHALLDRGIGILEEALGADHPQVWIARLAQASRDDNSLARSDAAFESHQRRVVEQFELGLARLEDAYGPEALVVAMTLDNMANAVSRTDPRRALEIGERSQAIWLATRGIDDPDVAHNVSNQGTRLHYLGRHREAADAQERALATLEAVRGGSHPDVREVLERLAISCIELGEHARARRALLRALEIPAAPDSGAPPRLLKWLARAELGLGNREAAAAAATRARDLLDPKEDAEARADIDAWLRARRLSSAHARRSAAR